MICIETRHFNLNRILLLSIGLWPKHQSKFVQLQTTLFFGILTSFIVFQLTTFVTSKCTPDLIIKVLSSSIFFFMFLIEYNSFWINIQTLRHSLEQLQHICNNLKDENEMAIIKEYGNSAKLYTATLALLIICVIFSVAFLPIWPRILDILLPINESRSSPTVQILTEYFIDHERYSYLILLHINASCCIGVTVVIATGTMLIGYLKHACGMFRIASYRIEKAITNNIRRNIKLNSEIMIYKEIVYAVDIHRKAMKFSEFLISNFEGSFFLLIAFGVICLSLNLFRMFQLVSFGGNIEEFLLHLMYIVIILIYMFLANYAGQEIMDHNNHVFFTVYNIRWYIAPLHTQRLIMLMLQRGNKPFGLNIGGLFIPCLENFATLTSASISYFTVMYSTQQ